MSREQNTMYKPPSCTSNKYILGDPDTKESLDSYIRHIPEWRTWANALRLSCPNHSIPPHPTPLLPPSAPRFDSLSGTCNPHVKPLPQTPSRSEMNSPGNHWTVTVWEHTQLEQRGKRSVEAGCDRTRRRLPGSDTDVSSIPWPVCYPKFLFHSE